MINFYVLAVFLYLHVNESQQASVEREVEEEATRLPYHLSYPNVTETTWACCQNMSRE